MNFAALELILNDSVLQRETFIEFLGVHADGKLTWHEYIGHCKSNSVRFLTVLLTEVRI